MIHRQRLLDLLCLVAAMLLIHVEAQDTTAGCGIENPAPSKKFQSGRIVGGTSVEWFRYPWFASFLLPLFNQPICGGVLVAPTYVVTAAHCYDMTPMGGNNVRTYRVVLGMMNRCMASETTRTTMGIKRVILHEGYRRKAKYFDIALIELANPAPPQYTPICLPKHITSPSPATSTSKKGLVMGTGVTKHSGSQPCDLQELEVNMYTKDECLASRLPLSVVREPTVFCAGYLEGDKDSCQGDSGGPMQVREKDEKGRERWVLRGVVSFGYGCARKGLPGVYTSVAHYTDWIQQTAGIELFPNSSLV